MTDDFDIDNDVEKEEDELEAAGLHEITGSEDIDDLEDAVVIPLVEESAEIETPKNGLEELEELERELEASSDTIGIPEDEDEEV